MNCQNELPYNSFPVSHSSIQPKGISTNRHSHATFKCMTPKGERILCMAATVSGSESGACVPWTELGKIYVSQSRVKNSMLNKQLVSNTKNKLLQNFHFSPGSGLKFRQLFQDLILKHTVDDILHFM